MVELNMQDKKDIKTFINIIQNAISGRENNVKDETLFRLVRRMQGTLAKFGEENVELTKPQNKIAEFYRDVALELFNNIKREVPTLTAEPDGILFENFNNDIVLIITLIVNDHPELFKHIIDIIVKKYNEGGQNIFD